MLDQPLLGRSMSSPHEPAAQRNILSPRWWWPLATGVLVGIAFRLLYSKPAGGPYNAMMSSFTLLVPALVGE
jgi:hypothetical protein